MKNFLRSPQALPVVGVIASWLPLSALALPFEINEDIRGMWNNSIVLGAAIRAKDADNQLVGYNNAVEHPGAKGAVSVADDGNLNYQKGDVISAPLIYTTDLELRYRNEYGVYGKMRSWYDYVGENNKVAHGSIANGYQSNQTLDDSDYYSYNKFSGYEMLDLYVYGNWDVGGNRLTGRLGQQSINWGESLLHLGINAFNPVNFSALGRPGIRQDDALVPVDRLYGNLITKSGISFEAFYALDWQASHFPDCGTIGQAIDDLISPACYAATAGFPLTDKQQYDLAPFGSNPFLTPRTKQNDPSSGGQYGLSTRYFVEPLDTEFGLYYVNYNAVNPVLDITLCADPNQSCSSLNGYALPLKYHEDVQAFAISAATGVRNLALSAELSEFRDLPVQRNFPELIEGTVAGRGIYADRAAAQAPGSKFEGGFMANRTQLLLGGLLDLSPSTGLTDASLAVEAAGQWNTNLPSTNVERIGRNPNWGAAADPGTGVCTLPVTSPASGVPNPECSTGGFATDFNWGYRVLATATFPKPALGIDLQPMIVWNQDVEGYAIDGSQIEGRKIINLRMRTIFQRAFFFDVGRTWFDSNTDYDPIRDRDIYSVAVGMAF